eukprot:TRINITY_DN8080_c0_g2_i1.p1 TRINITY_DN8080_c0_g2~~TRINITY_DN8080_c0_g2_i1.p1  ORF type:complete len:198 (+),score=58.70 TRINITY_DN8080_c0_g2_i1:100-693(+)
MKNGKLKRLHIITLGDHMVGKTSLLKRFSEDKFTFSTCTTIGIDSVSKEINVGKATVPVKLWDTAGQDRFHTITHSFYKQSQGVLLVFDVGNRRSFENLHKWIKNIQNYSSAEIVKHLIGNKIDTQDRQVFSPEAEKLAKEYNMKYFETSARSGKNVSEVITSLVREVYTKLGTPVSRGEVALKVEPNKSVLGNCCD